MVFAGHCRRAIPELLADRLPEERRERIGGHVLSCPRCRRAYAIELWIRRFAHEHFQGAIPADLEGRIRGALELEERQDSGRRLRLRRLVGGLGPDLG